MVAAARVFLVCAASLIFLAPLCVAQWEMAGPYGGSATYVTIDPRQPGHLLLGARDALLYETDDGGASWTRLPLPRQSMGNVRAIVIDPEDAKHYLVGVEAEGSAWAGLYESVDAGEHWSMAPDLKGNSIDALTVFPSDRKRIAAGTRKGVYLSDDNGKTWRAITPDDVLEMRGVTAVAFDPKNSSIIYAGTAHLPWRTSDGGKTWNSIHTGMIDDSDVFSIYVDQAQPDRIFASACSGIYHSADRGESWMKFKGIPHSQRRTHVIRQDPSNPNVLYAGTTEGLLKTADGGETWKQVDTLEINSLAIDPSNPKVLYIAAEYSGLWKSDDGGTTIHSLNRGFAGRRLGKITADGDTVYAAGTLDGGFQGVFRSENGGKTWQETSAGSAWAGHRLVALEGIPGKNLVFASTGDLLYRSSDRGRTWQIVPIRITTVAHVREPRAKARGARSRRVVISSRAVAPKIFALAVMHGAKPELVAATSMGLLRSANLGASFETVRLPGRETTVSLVQAAPDGSPRLVIRTEEGLLLSEGGSGDWKPLHAPVSASQIYDIAVSPQPDGPVLIGTTDGLYVWRSSDGWAKAKGLPAWTVNAVQFHPVRKGVAYAVQFDHLYESSDGGISWEPYSGADLGEIYARRLWVSPSRPDRLFAITPDTGVLLLDLSLVQ